MRAITATGPSHWASYLINGDASGLEVEEAALADRFVSECLGGAMPCDCEDAGFLWGHTAARYGIEPLGADCQTYTSLV